MVNPQSHFPVSRSPEASGRHSVTMATKKAWHTLTFRSLQTRSICQD